MVALLVGALAVGAAFWAVDYGRLREWEASQAHLKRSVTFRFNEPGDWTMIWHLENTGPGVARNLQITYAGVNSLCGTVRVPADPAAPRLDDNTEWKTGRECPGGLDLIRVDSPKPEDLPLIFVRPVEDVAPMFEVAAYSAVSREVNPREAVWLEFNFKTSPELDASLESQIPSAKQGLSYDRSEFSPFLEKFSEPSVSGVNITIANAGYEAIRLTK